jgi:hypothetical protein
MQHTIQANQLTLWTLLLCVAGLALVNRGRSLLGGVLLGLAGLIKVLPFLLGGYLVLRRRWVALTGMLTAVLFFDLLPCFLFFVWDGTLREHRAWLERAEWHSSTRQIEDPLLIGVYRHTSNFSFAGVLTRWLRGLPEAETMVVLEGAPPESVVKECQQTLKPHEVLVRAPRPPRDRAWAKVKRPLDHVPRFHIARLSAGLVWWIWAGVLALGMGGLALVTWRTGQRSGQRDWTLAGGLWILSIFFISPMARHYYLALAFPALAMVWSTLGEERKRLAGQWNPGTRLAALSLAAWFAGVLCLGWDVVRWYGFHLAVLALLIAATGWAWRIRILQDRA